MAEEQSDYITDVSEMMGWNEPKQIITEISGFVPIFDCVLEKYHNATRAIVHGAIWRFCQMKDGVCKASLTTIGEKTGLAPATIMRHAQVLCKDGYFIDLTPDLKNKPHVYADTGKVKMINRFHVSERNVSISQRNASVSESQLSKDINKEIYKKEKEGAKAPQPLKANQIPQIILYRKVTGKYPPKALQFKVIVWVDKVGDRLGREATEEDLRPFLEEWLKRGYNPMAATWLSDWAVPGNIPNGRNYDKTTTHQQGNAQREITDEDRPALEAIRASRERIKARVSDL